MVRDAYIADLIATLAVLDPIIGASTGRGRSAVPDPLIGGLTGRRVSCANCLVSPPGAGGKTRQFRFLAQGRTFHLHRL